MTFLGFCHSIQDAFAFFVCLASGQLSINLRGFHFCAPIALHDFDSFLSILVPVRLGPRRAHRAHSVSIAAVMGDIGLVFSCCTVMMSATEPMINIAASKVRSVTVSWANNAPSSMATIGFT